MEHIQLSEKSSVRVAVRVRPLNRREQGTKSITEVSNDSICLIDPATKKKKKFSYDFVYDVDTEQVQLYNDIGKRVINNAFQGYNSCVFAYGLTGCFAKSTPIMMFNGLYKDVQDIEISDTLMGDDSTPRNVIKLFHGRQMMYKIKPLSLGYDEYVVNADHVMVFKTANSPVLIEMTVHEYVTLSTASASTLSCVVTGVEFESKAVSKLFIDENQSHIPDEYKYNDRRVRMQVLDTLSNDKNDTRTIKCNEDLAVDVLFLARSLGFHAYYDGEKCTINTTDDCKYWQPVVTPVGVGDYYGFMLDGNHRFIGAGFNVLRNSGKSFSMMGDRNNPGLIPRICQSLFTKQSCHNNMDKSNCNVSYRVELSYIEIYSEQVIDLMDSSNINLKVRQHPDYGPYVENLTQLLVEDYGSIKRIIDRGNKGRHTAATLMNDRSSRSHAILTVYFTQVVEEGNITREVVSKINLVDLAGSERVNASGVTGINFQEAIQINKSLSTLGLVISKLAAKAVKSSKKAPGKSKKASKKKRTVKTRVVKVTDNLSKPATEKVTTKKKNVDLANHIPFRDSVLTWILKESLGGNSKTYMIATVSPSSGNYNESLSTLRYASNAKQIVNTVKINEDPNDKIIRVLHEEINVLRNKLNTKRESGVLNSPEIRYLTDELKQREELMKEKEKTWSDKLKANRAIEQKTIALHKEELTSKQAEFKEKLEHMDAERLALLNEMDALKTTMSDQELIQQRELDIELSKVQTEFEKQRDEFETTKIVATAVSLQEYYDERLTAIRAEYETKSNEPSEAFNKLLLDNADLKAQLNKSQKDLQFQVRRVTNERAVLNKQIQQLNVKIKTLETDLKDPSVQTRAYNAIKAKRDAEEQKFNIQQRAFEQLLDRIEDARKTLDDLNVKKALIIEELQ